MERVGLVSRVEEQLERDIGLEGCRRAGSWARREAGAQLRVSRSTVREPWQAGRQRLWCSTRAQDASGGGRGADAGEPGVACTTSAPRGPAAAGGYFSSSGSDGELLRLLRPGSKLDWPAGEGLLPLEDAARWSRASTARSWSSSC